MPTTTHRLEPLDPDSPKGREVAARLSVVLAEVRASIGRRHAREAVDARTAASSKMRSS